MAGRTSNVKTLRFRNIPTQWRGYAFFVEQGYNEQLNLSIINHLDLSPYIMQYDRSEDGIDYVVLLYRW